MMIRVPGNKYLLPVDCPDEASHDAATLIRLCAYRTLGPDRQTLITLGLFCPSAN
jgi:hypothetical protein